MVPEKFKVGSWKNIKFYIPEFFDIVESFFCASVEFKIVDLKPPDIHTCIRHSTVLCGILEITSKLVLSYSHGNWFADYVLFFRSRILNFFISNGKQILL